MRHGIVGNPMTWAGILFALAASAMAQGASIAQPPAADAAAWLQERGGSSAWSSDPPRSTDGLASLEIQEPNVGGGFGTAPEGSECTPSTIGNTFIEWDVLGNGPDWDEHKDLPRCQNAFYCFKPELEAPQYSVLPAGCDPTVSTCTLEVRVPAYVPFIHQETQLSVRVLAEWYGTAQPGGTPISSCGLFGGTISNDFGEAFLRVRNVSCDNLTGNRLRIYSLRVSACGASPDCAKRTSVPNIDLTAQRVAAELGCKEPRKDDCDSANSCTTCLSSGAGGASSGGGGGIFGGGFPWESGPGARLRYLGGGVGGDDFPGTPTWRTELGLYWSHDYAERIVEDPDDSHVWLLTKGGSFREFSDLVGGVYETASPTDEYRTLTRTAGGWELAELDGTVHAFNATGRWVSTTDRFGNAKTATYNVSDQLESVSFPDGRSETFTYDVGGKLASITEVGINDTTSRTWDYTWTGDELDRIDPPDGTALEFFYEDAGFPGYLTRVEMVGILGGRRVEAAWEYDAQGNVVALWRGDAVKTGPNVIDLWELSFDNPLLPSVTTVTDPLGAASTYTLERDTTGRKPKLTELEGSCPACSAGPNSTFAYNDSNHPLRPTLETDAQGHDTEMTYDAFGQILTRTEAMGEPEERTTTWTYHPTFPALVAEVRQPSTAGGVSERVTTFTYSASGALTQRLESGVEMPGGAYAYPTVFTPSPEGQNLVVDPPGYLTADQTTFTYDPARGSLLVASRTDPLVGTTTFEYDPFNRREKVTDPNLVETQTAYDAMNRVTQIAQRGAVPADDLITTHEYTEFGDLLRTTLPGRNTSAQRNVIEYGYDTSGRLVSVERKPDAGTPGERTVYTLDAIGNRTREELQRWTGSAFETRSFTDFQYQNRCQLQAVVYPDTTRTEYAYDCEGNLERVWDANHTSDNPPQPATTEYFYDALDRLITVMERWGGGGGGHAITRYGYDIQDHLTSVTDAERNLTTYLYSDRDLLTDEISPVSGTTSHLYNEHGELTQSTDARSIVTTRTVDEVDRVTAVDYGGVSSLATIYTYDDPLLPFSKGRLTKIERGGSSVDYAYDRFGRITQDGGLAYTYDKNGNRLNVVYPGGVTAVFTYDFADRPESLTVQRSGLPDQVVASGALYEPSGPLGDLQLGNSLTENRGFNGRYFPTDIHVGGAATLLQWLYANDSVGNILTITDGLDATQNRLYGYQDFQYYLTLGDGPWGNLAWTYDQIGNRLSEVRDALPQEDYVYLRNSSTPQGNTPILDEIQINTVPARDYQYGFAGHLERVTAGANEILFTSDAEGRLSRLMRDAGDARSDFHYDGRSFLTHATAGPSTTVFTDGFETGDARCWSSVIGDPNPPTPENCNPFPETLPIYSSDGVLMAVTKDPGQAGELTKYYLYFAGRPIAQLDRTSGGTETWRFLTTDHLGTPVMATDLAGTILWQGGFEPFGGDWSGAGAAEVDLRFPGQWVDESWLESSIGSEVYYNVHRWYENGTGRYWRVDPISRFLLPNSASEKNPYLYARSSPISNIDPLGLVTVQCEDCKSLGEAILNARKRIFLLQGTGSAINPAPGASNNPAASTTCASFTLPDGRIIGTQASTSREGRFTFPRNPCVFLCIGVHERVHRRMCKGFGGDLFNKLPESVVELPAYEAELKCLRSAKAQGSLELGLREVNF